ncbi:MAG: two-component sensor histidine kinase, partial [Clostridia bacterium]|nr:two-component sensor histidine kinase [Clostridia bacterium]
KNCKIVVSNTTDGVDAKNLDKLFDRFYRADKSRNSETGGNGIGLSVAKSIVNIHKGKISVRSDDGKNIAFTVII